MADSPKNVASKQVRRSRKGIKVSKDEEFTGEQLHELSLSNDELVGLFRTMLLADDFIGNGTFKGFTARSIANLITDIEYWILKLKPLLSKNEYEKVRNTLVPQEGIVQLEDSSYRRISIVTPDGKKQKVMRG